MKIDKKLIRDKIPEIIKADGRKPVTRILDDKEYLSELIEKLKEETEELEADLTMEELADIQEVLFAILDVFKSSREELEKVRAQKTKERGAFKKRIFLERVE
ncbi:MAG TPA: nucleoside triphosphate pyrophosphohydrolase [Candidatus Saccharimonadales bacterium]|nr:nucleoside triphosphate pyrophosphohydrolase [Candidatus Saccharimonadales bacterium]